MAGMPQSDGWVPTVLFALDGAGHIALNRGPRFRFAPAISRSALCEPQDEADPL
jgi:predicted 3-demethylubiquinone-9 3-methyltransferase (glyoxalase superfamily)